MPRADIRLTDMSISIPGVGIHGPGFHTYLMWEMELGTRVANAFDDVNGMGPDWQWFWAAVDAGLIEGPPHG